MFIQIEDTPNPNTLKFIPGCAVFDDACDGYPSCFTVDDDVSMSPIAGKLLNIDGVKSVYFGKDFISVSKDDSQDWQVLKPDILGVILTNFVNKIPVIVASSYGMSCELESLDEPTQKIVDILNTRVRPAVAQDGGDIVFHSFQDGIVYLKMRGACSGCPSSKLTLKSGIENMLKFYVPQVKEVRQVEEL